jgi:putative tricarboxylic transport membrane protein
MGTLVGMFEAIISMGLIFWVVLVIGVLVGMLVGVLPGLSFVVGVLLILPFTYGMEVNSALVLLVATYVAGTYGGAITSILINIPGEPNTVPLLWDGYAMTRQGRAAEALGWAVTAAVVGGFASWVLLTFAAEPFASVALQLSAPEYFVIVMLGLASVLVLAEGGAVIAAISAMLVGMLIGTVGIHETTGSVRYEFGIDILRDGIDYLAVMVGVYALGEVIKRFGENYSGQVRQEPGSVSTTIPGLRRLKDRGGSFFRGTALGMIMGAVPGAGATVASFVAYNLEKRFGKHKAEMGKGSPSGIIGPAAAGTATVGGALVPLLVLGIPGSAASAVLLGVLLLFNVQPGPRVFAEQPELMYTIFGALLLGLVGMFIVGILGAKWFIRLLNTPEVYVGAFVVLLTFIGALALRQSLSDVWIMVAFGIIGFFMQWYGYPIAPLVLGAILGPLAENYFLTTMISSANDWTVFFTRPISGVLSVMLILLVIWLLYKAVRPGRRQPSESSDRGTQ